MRNGFEQNLILVAGLVGLSLACSLSGRGTAIPAGRPVDFEVQTVTPTLRPEQEIAVEPEEIQPEPVLIVPLSDAPTHTPDPNATPTVLLLATDTPPVIIPTTATTQAVEIELTPSGEPASPTPLVAISPTPVVEPDPPLQGGDWDFEADFTPWPNPYGEPCPGSSVATGWTAFVEQGQFGSSCMNENLYQPNVFSGRKSQEITFDFIAANSGIFRTIPTKVGHRYAITAYAKHDRSISPVQMFLGVDLTGGITWQAETVQWFPWSSALEDTWLATEETVTASGESMTIFIRGHHPVAEQGGKTVIDNVSVTDLGL